MCREFDPNTSKTKQFLLDFIIAFYVLQLFFCFYSNHHFFRFFISARCFVLFCFFLCSTLRSHRHTFSHSFDFLMDDTFAYIMDSICWSKFNYADTFHVFVFVFSLGKRFSATCILYVRILCAFSHFSNKYIP